MEQNERKFERVSESQIQEFTLALQERDVDTTDSNDIAYQASFLAVGEEKVFEGYAHTVCVARDGEGLHVVSVSEISSAE